MIKFSLILILMQTGLHSWGQQHETLQAIIQQGHTNKITRIALDVKRRFLVSGDIVGDIKFWDFKTGILVKSISTRGCVSELKVSPDGSKMVSCDFDNHYSLLWDLSDLSAKKVKGISFINQVEFKPNSDLLVYSTLGKIEFRDPRTGQCIDSITKIAADIQIDREFIAFNHQGTQLAVRGIKKEGGTMLPVIILIDYPSKKIAQILEKASFNATSLCFSPDGKYLVSTGQHYEIRIWDLNSGHTIYFRQSAGIRYHYAQFVRDNQVLVLGEKRSGSRDPSLFIEKWSKDLKTSDFRLTAVSANPYEVFAPALCTDNDSLFCAVSARQTIQVINLFSAKKDFEVNKSFNKFIDVRFRPSSDDFLLTKEDELKTWNADNQVFTSSFRFQKPVRTISFDRWCNQAVTFDVSAEQAIMFNLDSKQFRQITVGGSEKRNDLFDLHKPDCYQLSGDGQLLAIGNMQGQLLFSHYPFTKSDLLLGEFDLGSAGNLVNPMNVICFSPDDRYVFFSGNFSDKLRAYDRKRKILEEVDHLHGASSMAASANGILAFYDQLGVISLYSQEDRIHLLDTIRTNLVSLENNPMSFSNKGETLALGAAQTLWLWDWKNHRLKSSTDVGYSVKSVQFIRNDSLLVIGNGNANFKIIRAADLKELLSIAFFNDLDWVAYTPEGFFDGTQGAWDLLPMSFSSRPWQLYNAEQFFNTFYQPGLAYDILTTCKDINTILQERKDERADADILKYINSKIPTLEITRVSVKAARNQIVRFKIKDEGSGVRNLKIFHNGILFHEVEGELQTSGPDRTFTLDLHLEMTAGLNTISAYVFNKDNLRSKEESLQVPTSFPKKKGDLCILNIGIDSYEVKQLKLNYAKADARLFSQVLSKTMGRQYIHHYSYPLYDANASKDKIVNALKVLAGTATADGTLPDIHRIGIDDVLIIFYSGHGFATGNTFYLIPSDVKISQNRTLENAIADSELVTLFKNINCRQIVLVIDACQSGQAIDTDPSKLGPFNSRGLAQLAYEKGMYIIAASQSQQSALEISTLGHGLLTYTMITKGLQQSEADYRPVDHNISVIEWLDYTVSTTPKEYRSVLAGKVELKKITPDSPDYTPQIPKAYFKRENYYSNLWIKKIK